VPAPEQVRLGAGSKTKTERRDLLQLLAPLSLSLQQEITGLWGE